MGKVFLPFFLLLASVGEITLLAQSNPRSGMGQLGTEPEMVPAPGTTDQFFWVQKSSSEDLFLTPNEVFFPIRGSRAAGKGDVPDIANLNGGNSFSHIEGWKEGHIAEWGIFLPSAGTLQVQWQIEGGGSFSLLDEEGKATPLRGSSIETSMATPGQQSIRLRCDAGTPATRVSFLHLSGSAIAGAGVIRKRWRPAAAHTKFTSSKNPDKVRLWIMEMDAVPGDLGFYCPITTPFGYYGPTWKADGTVNSGFNFSLWSFGRGAPEPPIEQLSHLLAIGNPDAKFSGFDHEGTGVKIRGWEPLEGRSGQRQAIALRVEPGERYDTYFSYFYASDEQRWRLFGAGKKWNKGKPLSSLWVGSFVEVPGPPPVQRTGPYERTMRYRGWILDEEGKLLALDQMSNGNVNKETGLTHTDRGTTEDGWFYLTTGGWTFRKPPADGEPIAMPDTATSDAPFLDPKKLAVLHSLSSSIEASQLERRSGKARITFDLQNQSTIEEAILYFGSDEGLTFAERWAQNVPIPDIRKGKNQFVFDDPDPSRPLRARLYLKTEEGQFWSSTTLTAPPAE